MRILFFLVTSIFFQCSNSDISPFTCPGCIQVRVGPPTFLYGPVGSPLDNPFFAIRSQGTLLGYSANGNTYIITEGSLNNTIPPSSAPVVLRKGTQGNFDECGSWINMAVAENNGNLVRAWYHAECACNYSDNAQTHKSIAYAESSDGGKNFEKIKYPNNQIITGVKPPTKGQQTGNGDHSLIVGNDGYYYIFFIDWDSYGMSVARSLISSGGIPGTWFKYYQGSFQEPGIGGKCTHVPNLQSNTVHPQQSGDLIGVTVNFGVSVIFGDNPLTWNSQAVPLIYADGNSWDRSPTAAELVAYPTVVPIDGTGNIGNEFWLYYTYLLPGEGFDKRYLLRRYVSFTIFNSTINSQSGTALVQYISGYDFWATTAFVPTTYKFNNLLGYIFPNQYPGTIPIFDCFITAWGDHMISVSKQECQEQGVVLIRQMGWILGSDPQSSVYTPIYRCFNSDRKHHSVSNNKDCNNQGNMEFVLGWILVQ